MNILEFFLKKYGNKDDFNFLNKYKDLGDFSYNKGDTYDEYFSTYGLEIPTPTKDNQKISKVDRCVVETLYEKEPFIRKYVRHLKIKWYDGNTLHTERDATILFNYRNNDILLPQNRDQFVGDYYLHGRIPDGSFYYANKLFERWIEYVITNYFYKDKKLILEVTRADKDLYYYEYCEFTNSFNEIENPNTLIAKISKLVGAFSTKDANEIKHNTSGHVVNFKKIDGGETTWEYDERGNVNKKVQMLGLKPQIEEWTYDESNEVTSYVSSNEYIDRFIKYKDIDHVHEDGNIVEIRRYKRHTKNWLEAQDGYVDLIIFFYLKDGVIKNEIFQLENTKAKVYDRRRFILHRGISINMKMWDEVMKNDVKSGPLAEIRNSLINE